MFNIHLPYDPTITLLGNILRNENCVYRKTCIRTSILAIFIIAKHWKQPKSSSAGEWIKISFWHIYTMEYNSAQQGINWYS